MKNTADRKQIAYDVAERAAGVIIGIRGFLPVREREYLESKLTVLANRLPRWQSASQIEWRLIGIAAAEVKTHFILDSDNVSEGDLWKRIHGLAA